MIKILHDGDYPTYLEHQKGKLDVYLDHDKKRMALERLARSHYKALKNRLRPYNLKDKKVLCLGARLGQEVRAFRDYKAFAVGIDLNPGPSNPYVHYGDFHDIKYPSKSVDVIYTNSLDHVFDFEKFIKEIKRVLKNDGILILEIQEGSNANIHAGQYEACWWDSADDVIRIFSDAEFYTMEQSDITVPFKSKHLAMTLNPILGSGPILNVYKEIYTREDLAKIATGIALELGVAAGGYSEKLLQNPKVKRLYSIDRWANDTKRHNDAEYISVLHRFRKYKDRSVILRWEFEMCVSMFNPVFDFIYIDGYAHTGQEGGKTLEQWWPKLKPGGIFAGHDYHSKWQPTVDAVNQFVSRLGLDLFVTKEIDIAKQIYPSWYIFKPGGNE